MLASMGTPTTRGDAIGSADDLAVEDGAGALPVGFAGANAVGVVDGVGPGRRPGRGVRTDDGPEASQVEEIETAFSEYRQPPNEKGREENVTKKKRKQRENYLTREIKTAWSCTLTPVANRTSGHRKSRDRKRERRLPFAFSHVPPERREKSRKRKNRSPEPRVFVFSLLRTKKKK